MVSVIAVIGVFFALRAKVEIRVFHIRSSVADRPSLRAGDQRPFWAWRAPGWAGREHARKLQLLQDERVVRGAASNSASRFAPRRGGVQAV
jgi:hypothetical protein